jgi:hypothetical protein
VIDRLREDELRRLAVLAEDCTEREIATAVKVLTSLGRDLRRHAPHTCNHPKETPSEH